MLIIQIIIKTFCEHAGVRNKSIVNYVGKSCIKYEIIILLNEQRMVTNYIRVSSEFMITRNRVKNLFSIHSPKIPTLLKFMIKSQRVS